MAKMMTMTKMDLEPTFLTARYAVGSADNVCAEKNIMIIMTILVMIMTSPKSIVVILLLLLLFVMTLMTMLMSTMLTCL